MSAPACLVTGGSGFIGRHLIAALLARDWHVRSLSRRPADRRAASGDPVEYVGGDLASAEALRGAVRGITHVFHCAGEKRDPAKFLAVNVEGTRRLVQACEAEGRPRLVHLSSVGVVGRHAAGPVDETTACRPEPGYEQSKYDAERMVRDYRDADGVPCIMIRPANVFGDGDPEHHLLVMMRTIQSGRFRLIGSRPAWVNYIYAGDVAGACAAVAAAAVPRHAIYQLADPCRIDVFASAMAQVLGAPPPKRLPAVVGYAAGVAGSALAACGRPFPVNLSKIKALRSPVVYPPDRMKDEFSWWPAEGWRSGLRRTITAYRAEGLL